MTQLGPVCKKRLGFLRANLIGEGGVAAADQNIRLDADGQQLLDRVLGGLGFQLVTAGNLGRGGDVNEQHISTAMLGCHLANGLQEGLALDVADGATDFGNDHVHIGTGHGVDPALDFVRDVGIICTMPPR